MRLRAFVPARFESLLFSVLMGLSMSLPMSFLMVGINGGFGSHFLERWLRGAATAFLVALPVASFVSPHIRKLTDKLVIKPAVPSAPNAASVDGSAASSS